MICQTMRVLSSTSVQSARCKVLSFVQPLISQASTASIEKGVVFVQQRYATQVLRRSYKNESRTGTYNTETVSYLTHDASKRTVYLVGTAHVSENSVKDVADAIELSKPDTVMVELCEGRAARMRSGEKPANFSNLAQGLVGNLFGGRSGSNVASELLLKAALSGMYSALRLLGLDPGAEFKKALEEADRRKLPVCLADRDVEETVHLLQDALSSSLADIAAAPRPPQELLKLQESSSFFNFTGSIESMKNRKQISLFRKHMQEVAPKVVRVMVDQRDKMMVDKLLTDCKPGCIVAVVGMAHMDGIEQEWQQRGGEVFLHHENSLRQD